MHLPEEILIRLIDGELDEYPRMAVRAHLQSCQKCQNKQGELLWTMRRFVELEAELADAIQPMPVLTRKAG